MEFRAINPPFCHIFEGHFALSSVGLLDILPGVGDAGSIEGARVGQSRSTFARAEKGGVQGTRCTHSLRFRSPSARTHTLWMGTRIDSRKKAGI
jgi:hypothetical protein